MFGKKRKKAINESKYFSKSNIYKLKRGKSFIHIDRSDGTSAHIRNTQYNRDKITAIKGKPVYGLTDITWL